MLCSSFVKFDLQEIDRVVSYLPDQKNPWFSNSRYCADRAQNLLGQAQTMYSECSRFHPNRFTFGGVIPERVKTVKTGRKVNSIFGCSLASIFRNDCLETKIPVDSRIKVICGDYHHILIIGSVCLCRGLSEHQPFTPRQTALLRPIYPV